MVDCKTCEFQYVCAMPDFVRNDLKLCRTYQQKKSQSNADRIRSMSDEELSEFLCGVFDEDECNGKYICGITIPDYDEDRIAEWLKSEAKE